MEKKSSPDMQITHFWEDRKKNQNLAHDVGWERVSFTSGECEKAIQLSCQLWREPSRGSIRDREQILDELALHRDLGLGRWVFSSLPPPSCLSGREGLLVIFIV